MFRRIMVLVCVALFATQAMAAIGTYNTIYDADQLPNLFPPGTLLASGTIGGASTHSIVDIGDGNNAWQVVTNSAGHGVYMHSASAEAYNAKLGAKSSIEFRLKVTEQPISVYEVVQVIITDNQMATENFWKIRGFLFASDYIVERSGTIGGQGEKVMFDTTSDFVTYRMDYTTATATADLYYHNGTEWVYLISSATGSDMTANVRDLFRIGQDSGNYAGSFQLDYVAWNQEPPTTCQEVWAKGFGNPMDFNKDCYVNLLDLAELASTWLFCNDPVDSECLQY